MTTDASNQDQQIQVELASAEAVLEQRAAEAEAGAEAEAEAEEIDWEVKAVLDKRIDPISNNVEYLLQWKNWDGPPTWEVEDNCDCTLLISRFETKRRKLEERRQSSQKMGSPKKKGRPKNKGTALLSQSRSNPRTPDSCTPLRRSSRAKKAIEIITISNSSESELDARQPDQSNQAYVSSERAGSNSTDRNKRVIEFDNQDDIMLVDNNVDNDGCSSSCSEASVVDDVCERTIIQRKLKLKEIVGVVNDKDILLVVKWHGVNNLEKVPLKTMRRFFCNDILEFFLQKIKWIN